jgi:Sel1 repeat-containing protein
MRNIIRAGITAVVLSLGLAAPLAAEPFEDALDAYRRGDYATAIRLWRPLADQGNAYAQFNLGFMYQNGRGVRQDDAAAVSWYQKAANQGNTLGQYNLGVTETNGTFDIMLDAFAPITVVPLLDELTTPKDWIIGISSGLLSGLLVILLLSFRVPKLRVSRNIVRKQSPGRKERYQIKVINRRRPWIVNAAAIDIRAELHVVNEVNQGAEKVRPISLFRSEPLIIPHTHRFRRWNGRSEHIFSVEYGEESKLSTRPIRFRIRARDSFSNYGKVFTQYYRPLGPLRWWERLIRFWRRESQLADPIVKGDWLAPGDLRVKRDP